MRPVAIWLPRGRKAHLRHGPRNLPKRKRSAQVAPHILRLAEMIRATRKARMEAGHLTPGRVRLDDPGILSRVPLRNKWLGTRQPRDAERVACWAYKHYMRGIT